MRLPLLTTTLSCMVLWAQTPAPDPFASLRFLVGEWTAVDAGGQPGKARGGELSLRVELDGQALVRRSFTEFPAQEGRPALRHDDLTVIFLEEGKAKALYLDNEGHVIHYLLSPLAGAEGVAFLSEGTQGPRMRLTYRKTGADTLDLAFDMALPGKDFVTHVRSSMRRKKPG
jgi:hypothetical protein